MGHGEGEGALVLEALEMLAVGQSDEEVFAELAARTGKWGVCLLAVCLALGMPRTDAEARLREVEPLILRALHRDEQLRTGNIVAADRSWFFTLYFDATGTELLACSGVKNERPSRGNGQKLQL
ncbi:hypothetical protein AB0D46_31030 [Streptomyces sp. NPDC048383]|uniref:hypothetical protein n=1 Tax=Streptomyces sp. NPDC048383 TaxID=3155386 RepID=UPI00343F053F